RLHLDGTALSRLAGMLAPGGLFLACEPEPNALWNLALGRYRNWWRDGNTETAASRLRSAEEWRAELAIAGFMAPGAAALEVGPWPSTVIWGRAASALPDAQPQRPAASVFIINRSKGDQAVRDRLVEAGHQVSEIDAEAFAGSASE